MTIRLSLAAVLAATLAASAAMAEPAPAKPAPAKPAMGVTKHGLGGLTAQEPAPAAKRRRPRPSSDGLLPILLAKPSADGKQADGAPGRPAARPKSPPPPKPPKRGRREVKLSPLGS